VDAKIILEKPGALIIWDEYTVSSLSGVKISELVKHCYIKMLQL
jgi:hypothetical protein